MNFDKAIEILELPKNFVERDLKKAYYKKALLYHPDKNKDVAATEMFKKIGASYAFLQKHKKMTIDIPPLNFHDMVKKCLQFIHLENKWENIFIDTTLQSILMNCKEIPLKVFEVLRKNKAIEIYEFLCKHKDMFSIPDNTLLKMLKIIKKKVTMDNIIVLNPSIKDMLNDHIYKLEIENKTYYIPLWHNEVCYDASGKDIIIKCIPELEKGITMDNDNNLYYIHHDSIETILKQKKVQFNLGTKVFEIPSLELKIVPRQIYTLYNKGIACIDNENIYNIKKRGHIYIEICLC